MSRRDARTRDRDRRELELLRRQHADLLRKIEAIEACGRPSWVDQQMVLPSLQRRLDRVSDALARREGTTPLPAPRRHSRT